MVEIIEARMEEIFDHVNAELKKISRDGKLPSGVVLTGGGSKLPGVVDFAKKHLRLPASVGKPQNINTIIDRVDDPAFATAVGLVFWGGRFSTSAGKNQFGGLVKNWLQNPNVAKFRKWMKSFLP